MTMPESPIKISVIIPVYNVQNYLKECIDSILNQDYTNLEVILINDGSTDDSGTICNKYAVKDQRIKVLHQENQGVAIARNLGLKHVTGDYISFIDADDWIDQGMYSHIVRSIDESKDIVDAVYMPYPYEKGDINKTIYNKSEIRDRFLHQFIGTRKINTAKMACVWSLLIRREIIKDLFFYPIAVFEDKPFFIEALAKANNLVILPKKYYNYRVNTTSLIRNYNKEYIQSMTFAHKIIPQILEKHGVISKRLIYLNNNSIVNFYYHAMKNEFRNQIINNDLTEIKNAIRIYSVSNNVQELLTWNRTFRLSLKNPKWLLIKLGYTDTVLRMLLEKRLKREKKIPHLLSQS